MESWELENLIQTLGIVLVVLIPVTGLTLRFAVKPFLKDLMELRAHRLHRASLEVDEQARQLAQIQSQLQDLESSLKNLTELVNFDRQLQEGPRKEEGRTPDAPH